MGWSIPEGPIEMNVSNDFLGPSVSIDQSPYSVGSLKFIAQNLNIHQTPSSPRRVASLNGVNIPRAAYCAELGLSAPSPDPPARARAWLDQYISSLGGITTLCRRPTRAPRQGDTASGACSETACGCGY